ncbi:MAG: NHL repeat-containing protein [Planctomycetota bacterium]|nr:NHL repeat-containing protein [Planctomycetota bacterium]
MQAANQILVIVALLAMLGACGGGGKAEFVPLEHNPLPDVPRGPDLSDDGNGPPSGTRTGPLELLRLSNFERAIAVKGQADFTGNQANRGGGVTRDSLYLSEWFGNNAYYQAGVTAGDFLWVCDKYNNRILRYILPTPGDTRGANLAVGQLNLNSAVAGTSDWRLDRPSDAVADNGRLYVCDTDNNRVLIFLTEPSGNAATAHLVVGQPDMVSNTPGTAAEQLNRPAGIHVGGGKLLVADTSNHRVLVWDRIPTTNGTKADLILGQPGELWRVPARTASGLDSPVAVWTDGQKLLVADAHNGRLMVWNTFPTKNGQAANLVLGAPNFIDVPTRAPSGANPDVIGVWDVDSNGTQIVVADPGFHRVLIWNAWPTTNHEPPDVVLGQSTLFAGAPNDDDQDGAADNGPSDRTLYRPRSVHIDGKRLYVSDVGNNRVLVFE